MRDYGRPLEFGYFLTPDAASYPQLITTAQRAEQMGLDLIGIQDHPYQARFLDAWTLLTAVAVQTTRLRLFADVANLPLRPPAVLAKSAASLDIMSGGRVELGIGAGAYWEAIAAMGGPTRTPGEAVAALEEAVQVIRLQWSSQRAVFFKGTFYQLRGVHPGPAPAHPIGLWIGAYGPKMLDLTGRLGDGWAPTLSYLKLEQLPSMQQRIDEGAVGAGRDPAAIQRIINVGGQITDGQNDGFLKGPVDRWIEDLTRLTLDYGLDSYIFAGSPDQQLDRFAQEVAPAVREQVARERRSR